MSHRKSLSVLTLVLALAAAPAFAEEQHHPAGIAPGRDNGAAGDAGMGQGAQQAEWQARWHAGMDAAWREAACRHADGMMREGGMQQQGMPMGMMCSMMRQGGMGSMPMGGMPMMADHTEGRIAFLKTELKITDAQLPLWNAVADAIRANAKSGMGMMDNMGQGISDRAPGRARKDSDRAS